MAKLLISPPNFILLDEPTTHLDIHGVEALTSAFQAYEGTLCFISHDLFFIKEIANHIVEVNNGVLRNYPGTLDYYLDKKQERAREAAQDTNAPASSDKKQKEKMNKPAEETELHKKHRAALNRIEEIKQTIKNLEKEKKDLDTESYVKSRMLTQSFNRRPQEELKQLGQRMKEIQARLREIETTTKALIEERNRISSK